METNEKSRAMTETAKQLRAIVQNRLNSRVEALNTLAGSPMDNVPADIQKMRESESAKIRAVIQEQKDLIDIIKLLFPDA